MTIGRVVFGPTDRDDAISRLTRERHELTELRLQVISLTRERDEARACHEPFIVAARNLEAKLDEVEAERDRLRALLDRAQAEITYGTALWDEIDAALKEVQP